MVKIGPVLGNNLRAWLEELIDETVQCECEELDCHGDGGDDCPLLAIEDELAEQIYKEGMKFMAELVKEVVG